MEGKRTTPTFTGKSTEVMETAVVLSQTAQKNGNLKHTTKPSSSSKEHSMANKCLTTVEVLCRTSSVSSILKVIFPMLSPTRLNSRITPALDSADVLVARGKSPSTSRKSTKLGSVCKSGWAATLLMNLYSTRAHALHTHHSKSHFPCPHNLGSQLPTSCLTVLRSNRCIQLIQQL